MPDLRISARSTPREVGSSPPPGHTAFVVTVADDLDMTTVDRFRHAYRALVDAAAAHGLSAGDLVVLDLSRVDFVSVDGAAALVEAKDLADTRGVDFMLVTRTRGVDHALAATGARRLFECHPTLDAARAARPGGADLLGHSARR